MKLKLPRLLRLPFPTSPEQFQRIMAENVLEVRPFLEAVLDVRWVELDILDAGAELRVSVAMEKSPLAVFTAWCQETVPPFAAELAGPLMWKWEDGQVVIPQWPTLFGTGPWRARLMIIGRGNLGAKAVRNG